MYTAIIVVMIAIAAFFFLSGIKRQSKFRITFGILIGLFTYFFFWFMSFYGELLWFEQLGFADRYWVMEFAQVGFALIGVIAGWFIMSLFLLPVPREKKAIKYSVKIVGAIVGATWGYGNWGVILKFFNLEYSGTRDPIFNLDTGFYLFNLPFYDSLYQLFLFLSVIAFLAVVASIFLKFDKTTFELNVPDIYDYKNVILFRALNMNAAILLLILAFGKILSRYQLMYSKTGIVTGPGWTDVNVKLPAYTLVIVIMLFLAIALMIPAVNKLFKKIFRRSKNIESPFFTIKTAAITTIVSWILFLSMIPAGFQWLIVTPNEITYESQYIQNNIKFTQLGFNLHKVEEMEYPVNDILTEATVRNNELLFNNIRLWDWKALDAIYKQFQVIRLYYEFNDVDVDRYMIDGKYRQVMIAAREMQPQNLPLQSQTFVNQRFKYTHGYGIALNPVNEFTPQGLPNLFVKDIPPVSAYPELNVEVPQIYYGELTTTHVIVNSKEEEFDYPRGEENVYIRYPGTGGVQLSNVWRKFLYGWMFDGTQLFFSGYPTNESRIMFDRQINDRVKKIAPFLEFERDPYVVLLNGRLSWIIDAYTTSINFPYSENFSSIENLEYSEGDSRRLLTRNVGGGMHGVNYIRNSVKAVIDAFTGDVDFYIMDEEDILIKVWNNIFPGIFKSKNEMPEEVYAHIRYPANLLLIQGLVYAKYHMTDPMVFYNQEDLWIRATEKYYGDVQPVEPYYIMWQLPDSDSPEFSLILPFTPKNRQVLIGWIAGLCDKENYGRFLAYKFPKDKLVIGPQQVETKIDQDRFLSAQLSLWDQRGSSVIRGNVLVIPVDETLMYVEPIYLQAQTAAYPELRLVVIMHNENLSYGNTFEDALKGILQPEGTDTVRTREQQMPEGFPQQTIPEVEAPPQPTEIPAGDIDRLIKNANDAFDNYLRLSGEKRFDEAARELRRLQESLNELNRRSGQ
jgi:uncharacterized protein